MTPRIVDQRPNLRIVLAFFEGGLPGSTQRRAEQCPRFALLGEIGLRHRVGVRVDPWYTHPAARAEEMSPEYKQVVAFAALVLVMVLRPQGLLAKRGTVAAAG